jgi:hypothetical protein
MNRISLVLLAGIGTLAISGCAKKSLVGIWKFKDLDLSKDLQDKMKQAHMDPSFLKQGLAKSQIQFKDATHFELSGPQTIDGTYSVDGSNVSLHNETIGGHSKAETLEAAKTKFQKNPTMLKQAQGNIEGMTGKLNDNGKEFDLDAGQGNTIKFSSPS